MNKRSRTIKYCCSCRVWTRLRGRSNEHACCPEQYLSQQETRLCVTDLTCPRSRKRPREPADGAFTARGFHYRRASVIDQGSPRRQRRQTDGRVDLLFNFILFYFPSEKGKMRQFALQRRCVHKQATIGNHSADGPDFSQ